MGLFFLALVFAAWSSLVAMIELASRILIDLGLTRRRAIMMVGSAGFLLGIPSAMRIGIFQNQDWVWGRGPHAVRLLLRLRGTQVRRQEVARDLHQHA